MSDRYHFKIALHAVVFLFPNWLLLLLQDELSKTRQRLQVIVDKQSRLRSTRNELRPIATHARLLYNLLSAMPSVNHMYQLSIQQFIQILQLSLQRFI